MSLTDYNEKWHTELLRLFLLYAIWDQRNLFYTVLITNCKTVKLSFDGHENLLRKWCAYYNLDEIVVHKLIKKYNQKIYIYKLI